MNMEDRKQHWEKIYTSKPLQEVSWYQPVPETSLSFFKKLHIPFDARIIDIGGGDSLLVDHLLDLGYKDITVLDISAAALERAKVRLGIRATELKWIVADINEFEPEEQYDFWHDRATFHFLTSETEVRHYVETVCRCLAPDGVFVVGTFSENGPEKCSGYTVHRYSEDEMTGLLEAYFQKIFCIPATHQTPFDTYQEFIFCSFRKPATTAIPA